VAVLVVTAALTLLLAFHYHQPLQPVVASILGILPALYLAYAAVPIDRRKPVYGRSVRRWDPVDLGVHQVIGGGPMPPYVYRPHDALLRAVLDPAVRAGRVVVVRGGSSTGKSRAAYEAVVSRLARWRLDYPLDPGALADRLEAGVPARMVLWLGELRHYADADGGPAVLGRLADLLDGGRCVVITTVWPEQWTAYTAAARAGPGADDSAGTVGRLLGPLRELAGRDPARIDPARGGVIDVPARFTTGEMEAAAATGDPALAAAAAAAAGAGQGGQLAQYLAGVPDLLDRWHKPGGDPYGQAILTAAIDATRLGHASPLPAGLVQDAAVGYLTDEERTEDIAIWRDTALAWATDELRGTVRAVRPVPPPSGTGIAGYRVADYLDQYGRRTRQDELGPASLWDALTAHADRASDLTRLGQAARDRGLYRHAAAFWTAAAALGSTDSARHLIGHLRQVGPGDISRAAHWVISHVSLDDPWAVAKLLETLDDAEADDAFITLTGWAVEQHASFDDPGAVGELLRVLREAGASDAITALIAQTADYVSLDHPTLVVKMLWVLREAGASDAARTLADRAVDGVSLDDPGAVAELLEELRGAGAAARTLADRAADNVSLDDPGPGDVAELLRVLREAGASDAVTILLARDPADRVSLHPARDVTELLRELREAGASDAARTLADRAADNVDLDHRGDVAGWLVPGAVARLLKELREAGASDAARTLADRAAANVSLDDPEAVARLLKELREAGASDAVTILLARDPAARAPIDDPGDVVSLLVELREAGASDAVQALAARAAAHAPLNQPSAVGELLQELSAAGASDAVTILLARDPAGHVSLDNLDAVARLLDTLRKAGASNAVRTLADRTADRVSLGDPGAIARLLDTLREAGASNAARTLLDRGPAARADLDDRGGVAQLLRTLDEAGADNAARTLASRAANAGMFDLFLQARPDEAARYPFGREPDATPSQPWKWQEPAS
jgi:uncharacterized protein YidB (DUF937 family)